jgi:hypothetical protein
MAYHVLYYNKIGIEADFMPLTRRVLALLMLLLLCSSQLATAQHGIDHLVAPPDHACTQCLHHPGQKHALLHANQHATAVLAEPAYFLPAVPAWNGNPSRLYQSRAPPISFR